MRRATSRAIAAAASIGLTGCLSAPSEGGPAPADGDAAGVDASSDGDVAPATVDLLPTGLPSTTALLGDQDGGSTYDLLCPPGRFVTGLDSAGSIFGLARLRATCSRLQIAVDGQTEVLDSVYTAPVGEDADAEAIEPVDCSPGLIAVGYDGSLSENDVVTHLALNCAPVEWAPGPVMAEPSEATPELGQPDGFATGSGMCDPGWAAGGIAGQSGLLIDSFQLQCFQLEARPAG